MSNQICVRVHTQPGDEMLCEEGCHIYYYEAGGPAVLSGVMCHTFRGDYGILDVSQLEGQVRPANDHFVKTRLVSLENTHNRGGGRIFPLDKIRAIRAWTRRHNLALHLDGARLWNAVVATGTPARTWAEQVDTVSVCFSKGLGAPVGSALVGPRDFVTRARQIRKLFGGGMRQAGILAAAALYALDNHVERLADDHRNARVLGQAVADTPGLRLDPPDVHTNIVWIEVDPDLGSAKKVADALKERGLLVSPATPTRIRMVTHLDVSAAMAERAADTLRRVVPKLSPVA
jgi:threonine aldolase